MIEFVRLDEAKRLPAGLKVSDQNLVYYSIPAGRIAELMQMPASSLSFHLKELHRAGLLASRQEGRSIIYMARPTGLSHAELLRWQYVLAGFPLCHCTTCSTRYAVRS